MFAASTAERRQKVRELAAVVEEQVNAKIDSMVEETKRYKTEMAKIDFRMAQLEREKRLEQAARHPG
jgi:hypothetical protein